MGDIIWHQFARIHPKPLKLPRRRAPVVRYPLERGVVQYSDKAPTLNKSRVDCCDYSYSPAPQRIELLIACGGS